MTVWLTSPRTSHALHGVGDVAWSEVIREMIAPV